MMGNNSRAYVLSHGNSDRVVIKDNKRYYAVTLTDGQYHIARFDHVDVSGFHDVEVDSVWGIITSIDELCGDETPMTRLRGLAHPGALADDVVSQVRKIFGPYLETLRVP